MPVTLPFTFVPSTVAKSADVNANFAAVAAAVNAIAIPVPVTLALDDFERADQLGIGTAQTGQAWSVSGPGAATAQIQSGRLTNGPQAASATMYCSILCASKPVRYGARFSWAAGAGATTTDPIAIISSSNATATLDQMLHLIINPTTWRLTTWNGAAQDVVLASESDPRATFPTPLLTDGTVYECWITVQGNNVHIDLPDGTTADFSDPLVPTVSGNLLIYETTYNSASAYLQRFESIAAYGPAPQTQQGPLNVVGGFQGPVGSITPAAGYFTQVGVGTKAPTVPLHAVRIGVGDVALFSNSTEHAYVRIKRTANGYGCYLVFDQGSVNPPYIYSGGNAFDIRIATLGVDRMIFPQSGDPQMQDHLDFVASKVLKMATVQVVSSRKTGWTAWTGTATRTTQATSSATLLNVAEAVKALTDDLIAHGLIGT